MKSLFFILFGLLIITSINSQTTYYIDATNGNDANNGTSTSTAWKSIDQVNEQAYIAGDHILFKKGEIWKGTRLYIEDFSGSSTENIIYGAYGSGEKPIISAVVPHSHSWTNIGGNIWKATNPPEEHPERILINGVERLRANIQSELDGVNYYWMYDNNTNDFYVFSSENPNTTTYEYSTDLPIIIGYSNNITVQNLDIQGGWTGLFITTKTENIHLDNLTIGKYSREGIIIETDSDNPSEFPKNILVENCIFDAYFAFDYSTAGTYAESSDRGCSDGYRTTVLDTGEIRNCYFKNWGHASINIDGLAVSNVSIHNNYLTSPDICYGGRIAIDDASYTEIYNNQIIDTSVQSQLNGQFSHIHHNIFSGTKNTPLVADNIDAGVEMQGYSYSDVTNNIFENNLIINTKGPGFRISGNNNYAIYNNSIRNNIIYNCGIQANDMGIVVEENLFEETYNNSFQNNLIYNSSTTQTFNFRGNVFDVTGFNAQNGIDNYNIANNITGNPLFIDENNEDFHLLANSPCINTGTNTLASYDFEGNTIPLNGTNPDIGIYEHQIPFSITDVINANGILTVYPNPTKNWININATNLEQYTIEILNTEGQVVLKNTVTNQRIDLSLLANGVYFLKLMGYNSIITKRIILGDGNNN